MKEILDAIGPLTAANVGGIILLIWGPGLALAFIMIWRLYGERNILPRELIVAAIGMFAAMACIPLCVAWQSFGGLPLESWAKLTAAQVAACLLFMLVSWKALGGTRSPTTHHFVQDWKRRRHIIAVVLPLAGLLLAGLSTRNFIEYLSGDRSTAVAIERVMSRDGRQLLVKAEWAAPDGKKIPVMLAYDHMHVFRPRQVAGLAMPIRINAQEMAAGKVEPLYIVDTGVVARLLNYLSVALLGLGALAAGIMTRREKTA